MAFILAEQRDIDCVKAFDDYRSYLAASANIFPPSALSLANSDWYFGASKGDHGPHDARLINCVLGEPLGFDAYQPPSITVRLMEAYGDGYIELLYPQVFHFNLFYKGEAGHQDWRYDEFRATGNGHVIHEIEWSGAVDTGRWLIEASDVIYTWTPRQKTK